jgi:cell division protein FtsB
MVSILNNYNQIFDIIENKTSLLENNLYLNLSKNYLNNDLFIYYNIMESIIKNYKIKKLKKENKELKKENKELKKENKELKEDNRISSEIFEDQYIQFKNRNNLNWW